MVEGAPRIQRANRRPRKRSRSCSGSCAPLGPESRTPGGGASGFLSATMSLRLRLDARRSWGLPGVARNLELVDEVRMVVVADDRVDPLCERPCRRARSLPARGGFVALRAQLLGELATWLR
jgi:hypothetical protein